MLSAVVLVALNLLAACCVLLAFVMVPEDRWDRDALDGAGIGALLGMGVAVATAALTVLPVALRWLGRRWFAAPAALFVLAAARYAWVSQVYDPW
ncbi:hypothetical protein GCM10010406_51810 [Streptomyces thermolineatus]|uniref:Uncharacterized protein n=1 Tax=Streptomyces thermolineatus TaxID=44033 RepID=A0ABN3MU75_9ACTN